MKKSIWLSFLVIILITSSCNNASPTPKTEFSSTDTPPPTKTSSPVPVSVHSPIVELPVQMGTAYPSPSASLGASPNQKVTELARWGNGVFNQIEVSPDGKELTIATTIGVYFYDAQTFKLLHSEITGGNVSYIKYSPDGKLLAAHTKNSIQVWQASDRALLYSLETNGKSSDEESFDFSPDSKIIATIEGSSVKFWDANTGQLQSETTLKVEAGSFTLFRYLDQNSLLIFSRGLTNTLVKLDVSGKTVYSVLLEKMPAQQQISENQKFVAFSQYTNDKILLAFDTATGQKIEISTPEGLAGFVFSPDGSRVAVAMKNKDVCIWSLPEEKQLSCVQAEYPVYYSQSFLSGGKSLIVFGWASANIWDTGSGQQVKSISNDAVTNVSQVLLARMGILYVRDSSTQAITALSEDGHALGQITDFFGSGYTNTITAIPAGSTIVKEAQKQSLLVLGGQNNPGLLYDAQTGTPIKSSQFQQIAVSSDGTVAGILDWHGLNIVKSEGSGMPANQPLNLTQADDKIKSISISANGQLLGAAVEGTTSSTIQLWTTKDRSQVSTIALPTESQKINITSLAISANGSTLAVGVYSLGGKTTEQVIVYDISNPKAPVKILGMDSKWAPSGFVFSIAFSPDGKVIALAETDGTITFFDTTTWKDRILQFSVNTIPQAITFLDDGKTLAIAGRDGLIRVWGVAPESTNEMAAIESPPASSSAVPSSTNSSTDPLAYQGTPYPSPEIAFGSSPGAKVIQLAQWGMGALSCMAVSPDTKFAALCSVNGIILYNTSSLALVKTIKSASPPKHVIFSPDGTLLAGKPRNNSISVWSTVDGAQLFTYSIEQSNSTSIYKAGNFTFDFSPDGQSLAVLIGYELTILDAKTGKVISQPTLPIGEEPSFVHYVNANSLVLMQYDTSSNGQKSGISWFDIPSSTSNGQVSFPNISNIVFSADNKVLAASSSDTDSKGKLQLFDAQGGKPIGGTITLDARVSDLEFSPNADLLAVSLYNKQICVWNVANVTLQTCLTEDIGNAPDNIRFSSDGKFLLASTPYYNQVKVWDTKNWDSSFSPSSPSSIQSIEAMTNNSNTFLLWNQNGIALWNIEPVLQHQHKAPGEVKVLAYSPDEKTVVAAGSWGIEILDAATGQALTNIPDSAETLCFSTDGKIFAAGRPDGSIAIYSKEGNLLQTLNGLTQPAKMLAFLQKNVTLIASGSAETRLWNVADGTLLSVPESDPVNLLTVLDGALFTVDGKNFDGEFLAFENDLFSRSWIIGNGKVHLKSTALQNAVKDILVATILPDNTLAVLSKTDLIGFDILFGIKKWQHPLDVTSPQALLAKNANSSVMALLGNNQALIINSAGKTIRRFQGQFESMAVSYTGKELALSTGSDVQIWDNSFAPTIQVQDFTRSDSSLNLSYASDGQKVSQNLPNKPLLIWGDGYSVKLINPTDGTVYGNLVTPFIKTIKELVYSQDMQLYAFIGINGDLHIIVDGREVEVDKNPEYFTSSHLSLTADGKYLAVVFFSGSDKMALSILDTTNGRLIASIKKPKETYYSIAFAPNGKTLAAVGLDGLLIYDTTNINAPKLTQTIKLYGYGLAFSPDGKYLALGDTYGKITVLDAQNQWEPSLTFDSHQGNIDSLMFQPDGKVLVSTGKDGTLRLWGWSK